MQATLLLLLWVGQAEPELEGRPLAQWVFDLQDEDAGQRIRAAEALRGAEPGMEAAIPGLTKALGDSEPRVRRAVAFTLGLFGEQSQEAVEPLAKLLSDEELAVRYAAAQALGEIGEPALPASPALLQTLRDESPLVRVRAAEALFWSNPDEAERATDLLRDVARDDGQRRGDRVEAAATLVRLAPEKARFTIPILAEAARNQDPFLQIRAADALTILSPDRASDVIPTLVDLMRNPDEQPRIRIAAVKVLARLDREQALTGKAMLLRYAREARGRDRVEALEALNALSEPEKDPPAGL